MIKPEEDHIPIDGTFYNNQHKIRNHHENWDSMECKQLVLYQAVNGSHLESVQELLLLGASVDQRA